MKNLSKYLTLNVLSVLGYGIFAIILYLTFVFIFIIKSFDESYGVVVLAGYITIFYFLVYILTIFTSFFEFLIYKLKKIEPIVKIPNKFNKIHLICFIVGILLSFIPFVIVSYILINSDS